MVVGLRIVIGKENKILILYNELGCRLFYIVGFLKRKLVDFLDIIEKYKLFFGVYVITKVY